MADPDLDHRVNRLESKVRSLEKMLQESGWKISERSNFRVGLKQPVKRTPEDIEKGLAIVGVGEGPEDMSRRFHAYLLGEEA